MKIKIDDLRVCGVCPRARLWFDRHGLDWRGFVRDGIDSAALRATGDQYAMIERLERVAAHRIAANE